jgi:hypothetical protein
LEETQDQYSGPRSAPKTREGTKKGEPAAQTKPAGPPIPVTAETLTKDFRTDKAAAEAKYGGKLLEVTGKVHDVYGKEISGQPTVILWGYQEKTELGSEKFRSRSRSRASSGAPSP